MRPLAGVTAVTLAVNTPGPVAAARMRELGAEVTKVEPPAGDPLELVSRSWYQELRAGQTIVRLDLKTKGGRAELGGLLEGADVLLTSHRPAALERLGLAWVGLHARHPRLVQVAIVGHGAPDQHVAGHDLTYLAARGLLAPPELPRTLIADLGGAERAVSAVLGLLLARERGEEAGYFEVALAEAADSFAAPLRHGLTAPGGVLGGGLPVYGLYRAREGWIALGALEPHFQEGLRNGLELAELTREGLEQAFAARVAEEWEAWARTRDLPLEAVRGG
ncbi:MAG: CoA transferase [Actinobacteria bacterium]|nr:CoA transferase [Actinomycetota bacterium]